MNKIKYLYMVSLLFFCSVLFVSCAGLLSDLFNLKEKLKGDNGSIYWNYHVLSSILTIDGTINNQVLSNFEIPEISKDQVYTIILGNNISEIGDHVFEDYNNLSSITIPPSVTTIGECAFSNCISLSSITIPPSVTTIKSNAFNGWQSDQLIKLSWLKNDTTSRSLNGLSSNTIIQYLEDFTTINSYTDFTQWYAITDNLLIIGGEGAFILNSCIFYEKEDITSLFVCEGITEYSSSESNHNFRYVSLPQTLTSIGFYAFYNCTSLSSITIPDSVTSIGSHAFKKCSSLSSITIPSSVTSIQVCAFERCTSLSSISIPDSVTYIDYNTFKNCTSLSSITIPNSVTYIEDSAFYNCTSLSSITIPNSVTYIGSYAFDNWTSNQSIYLDWSSIDTTSRLLNGLNNINAQCYYNNGTKFN